ncbi:hypothetical protein D3C81_1970780 [compost metagenome]
MNRLDDRTDGTAAVFRGFVTMQLEKVQPAKIRNLIDLIQLFINKYACSRDIWGK